ncbi:MAG TPA: DUF4395 family protein [Egibacteraceae bacterium]|nr:DUF4395 family protein [Egibacteraceae bacterium]
MAELTSLLRDDSLTRAQRLTRLQGWRGVDAACAEAAPAAQRIGPAVCAVGALLGAALQAPLVPALFAATALAGAVAPHHPFESLSNRWARRRGSGALPPNRAAKRFGCAVGVAFLGGAALAFASGATTLGVVLSLMLGCTAAFVAVTGICLPSMLFTVLWGAERAAAPHLFGAPDSARSDA